MMITPTGTVGIGTTTPGSALDVAGDINYSGAIRQQGSIILQMQQGVSGYNLAAGLGALAKNSGSYNTATGWEALNNNTTGAANTAVGSFALLNNTTGETNMAIGDSTLYSNTTGSLNTSVGASALFSNSIGFSNTAIGYQALLGNVTGQNNIALGSKAGSSVTTGSNNIHIGTQGSATDVTTIRIGGSTSLGDPAAQTQFFVAGVNGVQTGLNNAVPVLIDGNGQLGTMNSSRRYKEDIQDMGDASKALIRLRPVTFRYHKPFADGSKPIQYGLIAEEVAEVYPDLVAHSADGQIETVKYQVLDSMLLNEVQRQHREIGSQQENIQRLADELSNARQQNQALQERLSRLEALMASAATSAVK
jgi:hypothetical protein